MADNSSKHHTIVKAASACVWKQDHVLLVQRANDVGKGLWSLPGGKQEAGETLLQTALRELLEETGVMARLENTVGEFAIHTPHHHYAITCFSGPWLQGEAQAASDAAQLIWLPWQNLKDLPLAPNTLEAVLLARKFTSL
jgi:8-oxo-dGTP diphosphatase